MSQRSWKRQLPLVLALLMALSLFGAVPAFAAGNQSGDQICTGDNITITTGQTVNNVFALGCNVDVEQGATVQGSIADFGGNVQVAGNVNGNIAGIGGNVLLTETATVNGNVNVVGGNYYIAPGATVHGNSGNTLLVPPVPPIAPVSPMQSASRQPFWGFNILGGIITALAFAALGALVVIFAPNATKRVSDAAQAKPLNTIGVGCLTAFVFPILAILLIITLIGIPVAFLLGIAAWAAWIFGGIAIGLLAGEKILGAFQVKNILPVVAAILGIVILMLLGQVPVLGWLLSCLVGLIGLGAVVMTRFGTRPYPPTPTMSMVPVTPRPAASVPGTYTPSSVDVAAWEAKARDAQTTSDTSAAEPPPAAPPSTTDSGEPKSDER